MAECLCENIRKLFGKVRRKLSKLEYQQITRKIRKLPERVAANTKHVLLNCLGYNETKIIMNFFFFWPCNSDREKMNNKLIIIKQRLHDTSYIWHKKEKMKNLYLHTEWICPDWVLIDAETRDTFHLCPGHDWLLSHKRKHKKKHSPTKINTRNKKDSELFWAWYCSTTSSIHPSLSKINF